MPALGLNIQIANRFRAACAAATGRSPAGRLPSENALLCHADAAKPALAKPDLA